MFGSMSKNADYTFKLHLVGKKNAGKTKLISRLHDGDYEESPVDLGPFARSVEKTIDHKLIQLQLQNAAKTTRVTPITQKDFDAVFILCDLKNELDFKKLQTNEQEFKELHKWINIYAPLGVPIFLVGTKCDLLEANQLEKVKERLENLKTVTPQIKANYYISSKTGAGIETLVQGVTETLIANLENAALNSLIPDKYKRYLPEIYKIWRSNSPLTKKYLSVLELYYTPADWLQNHTAEIKAFVENPNNQTKKPYEILEAIKHIPKAAGGKLEAFCKTLEVMAMPEYYVDVQHNKLRR